MKSFKGFCIVDKDGVPIENMWSCRGNASGIVQFRLGTKVFSSWNNWCWEDQVNKISKLLSDMDWCIEEVDFYDPAERAREKQAARDQDESDLASGKITIHELIRRNGFFHGVKHLTLVRLNE